MIGHSRRTLDPKCDALKCRFLFVSAHDLRDSNGEQSVAFPDRLSFRALSGRLFRRGRAVPVDSTVPHEKKNNAREKNRKQKPTAHMSVQPRAACSTPKPQGRGGCYGKLPIREEQHKLDKRMMYRLWPIAVKGGTTGANTASSR